METDKNGSKLLLRYPIDSVIGTYSCLASNIAGNKTGSIQVNIPTIDLTSPAGQALKASIVVTTMVVVLLLIVVAYCYRKSQVIQKGSSLKSLVCDKLPKIANLTYLNLYNSN